MRRSHTAPADPAIEALRRRRFMSRSCGSGVLDRPVGFEDHSPDLVTRDGHATAVVEKITLEVDEEKRPTPHAIPIRLHRLSILNRENDRVGESTRVAHRTESFQRRFPIP